MQPVFVPYLPRIQTAGPATPVMEHHSRREKTNSWHRTSSSRPLRVTSAPAAARSSRAAASGVTPCGQRPRLLLPSSPTRPTTAGSPRCCVPSRTPTPADAESHPTGFPGLFCNSQKRPGTGRNTFDFIRPRQGCFLFVVYWKHGKNLFLL